MKFIVICNKVKIPIYQEEDYYEEDYDFVYRFSFQVFSDVAPKCSIATETSEGLWYCLNCFEDHRDKVISCIKLIYPNVENLGWKIREDGWITYIIYGDLPEYPDEPESVKNARSIISEFESKQREILNRGSSKIYEIT